MKKFISAAIIAFVSLTAVSAHAGTDEGCDGHRNIISAYTVKGNKYAAFCMVGDKVRYSFGKDGAKPEMQVDLPVDQVELAINPNGDASASFTRGEYTYTMVDPVRDEPVLLVEKNYNPVANIALSRAVLENDIVDFIER